MGQYPGSFKLEYLWHPEGRKPEIRSTHLREPTCNFHAQSESRRLARRCDAYSPTNWTTYKDRNEVGSFRRDFDIPQDWDGREVFISFDGVDSFFYLWINGQYVGFSKNSRNTANFNITPYLQKGKNTVAAEVYRSSDGSFLEAQDMFRLPGIFRTVALYSTPKVQVRDLVVIPDLDETYTNGSLAISADIRNYGKKAAKGYQMAYTLYANKLYSDENTPLPMRLPMLLWTW